MNPLFSNFLTVLGISFDISLLISGLADFVATWGDRPLEDNWRRQDKSSDLVSFNSQENVNSEGLNQNVPEDQTEKFYLKGLNIKPNHNGINEYLGELYVQTNRIDKANERLAILKNCGCKEYSELELIIKTRGVKVY